MQYVLLEELVYEAILIINALKMLHKNNFGNSKMPLTCLGKHFWGMNDKIGIMIRLTQKQPILAKNCTKIKSFACVIFEICQHLPPLVFQ